MKAEEPHKFLPLYHTYFSTLALSLSAKEPLSKSNAFYLKENLVFGDKALIIYGRSK